MLLVLFKYCIAPPLLSGDISNEINYMCTNFVPLYRALKLTFEAITSVFYVKTHYR